MKYSIIIFLIFLSVKNIYSQNLTGRVTDTSGNPINAATIFIQETRQGLLSNTDGYYQASINNGSYFLIYRAPGYKEANTSISISNNDTIRINIALAEDSLFITEVENKAYANTIIRNCIKKAPVYFNGLKYYKAGHYINGKMVVKNVSGLVDRVSHKFDNFYISDYKGQTIFHETYNHLEYHYPDIYKIDVDGNSGFIPGDITKKIITTQTEGSIYSKKFFGVISPISHNAFRFYKYTYEGYYLNNGSKQHKIKVEPRINDPELFNGYLYIKDNSWSMDLVVLSSNAGGIKSTVTIAYFDIRDNISVPVTFYDNMNYDFMASAGNIQYYSGINYQVISDKEHPVNSEDSKFNNEEINNREESYWDNVRMHPKSDKPDIHLSDTIGYMSAFKKITKFWLSKVIIGGYIAGDENSDFSLKYNGVKMIFRDYNYVDGFWLGNKFDIKKKFNNNMNLEAYPYLYYTTARHRIVGGSDIFYNYSPKRKGQVSLRFGSRSEDFNNLTITRYQNYFNSLILGENDNFFYQRDFVALGNDIHLNKKIKFSASVGVEKRSGLSNHTDFNILGKNNIKPNIFPNDRFDRTYYTVSLSYSPNSNYSITEALEMHTHNITPVFNIEYSEGFSNWQTNNSTYRKLKGGIIHNIRLDHFNHIDYKIEAGVFFRKGKNMHFTDYQHFGASDMLLNLNSLFDSFLLLDNYELQTNRYWVNLFLNYSGKYVLLKFIPFLQGKPFTENLHLKTLYTPETKSYIETGYSVSFNRYFGVGAFTSFHNIQGKRFGIRLSLNLRSLNII